MVLSNCKIFNEFLLKSQTSLAEAAYEIAAENFKPITTNVNMISWENSNFLKDFKDSFLTKLSRKFKFTISLDSFQVGSVVFGRIKRCSTIFVKSFQDFLIIYGKISPEIFRFNGFFLIVLVDGEILEIHEIFKLMWKIQIFKNVVFENNSGEVQVKTFKPFNGKNCYDTTPKLINRYKNGKFEKDLKTIYPKKMKNLHKCPIRVSVSNDSEPYIFVRPMKNGSFEFSGDSFEIISTLAKILNFKVNFSYAGSEGFILDNGTAEGPMKALMDGNADLTINNWWLKSNRLKYFSATVSYSSEKLVLVIPPGKNLSSFEKLAYPFSLTLWIMIAG